MGEDQLEAERGLACNCAEGAARHNLKYCLQLKTKDVGGSSGGGGKSPLDAGFSGPSPLIGVSRYFSILLFLVQRREFPLQMYVSYKRVTFTGFQSFSYIRCFFTPKQNKNQPYAKETYLGWCRLYPHTLPMQVPPEPSRAGSGHICQNDGEPSCASHPPATGVCAKLVQGTMP